MKILVPNLLYGIPSEQDFREIYLPREAENIRNPQITDPPILETKQKEKERLLTKGEINKPSIMLSF